MEDEIEDIVGDVRYVDSQKSIATRSSHMYSPDFTDCSSRSSDKNNSSGKETYVLEWDSEDSEHNFPLQDCVSNILTDPTASQITTIQCIPVAQTKSATTSIHRCSIQAQEIYTQTSKTIIELAETEGTVKRKVDSTSLETQTSFLSITENKTIEYRIEVSSIHENFAKTEDLQPVQKTTAFHTLTNNAVDLSPYDDDSSKIPVSETEDETTADNDSECSSMIRIIDDDSKDTIESENKEQIPQVERASDCGESLCSNSDIEEDSLMAEPIDANKDVKELREKISENPQLCLERYEDDIRRFGTLTPLTEESAVKKDSLMDITPNENNIAEANRGDVLFTSNAGMKVKLLREDDGDRKSFKLPPIQNHSCPSSPHLNSLFGKQKLNKAGTLPSVYERQSLQDRWEIATKTLASGESPLISGRSESPRKPVQLPPIHSEVPTMLKRIARGTSPPTDVTTDTADSISIKEKIKELKMSKQRRTVDSRSGSPCSVTSPEEHRLCDIADRGCETLCVELLRRLRAGTWFEVVDTLDEVPNVLEKFWAVITEQRIADLVRQVNIHVESPRPQVARAACATVAAILKNTNYTKKPDFYEAVTLLLIKTGSYSRAVRRAANVALDNIVSGIELTHAVTALCLHGVGHKNAVVRCAAARLLVVSCALGGGGRELLRARPASAAAARRRALAALAALLDDKSTDTRKYAERLYIMLRPLSNFEAYYLTDVDVELASRQMKKYDQLLMCTPKENR